MTDDIGRAIREASESVSAPMQLRESVARKQEAQSKRRPGQHSRRDLVMVGATLAIIATIAGFLAPSGPTVVQVAEAGLNAPETAAPAGSDYLTGFEAIGAREDTVSGREAKTVIYKRGTVGVHYTIVDGKPLDLPGSRREQVGDLELAVVREDGVNLVAWHRDGKTCILASKAEDLDGLVELIRRA